MRWPVVGVYAVVLVWRSVEHLISEWIPRHVFTNAVVPLHNLRSATVLSQLSSSSNADEAISRPSAVMWRWLESSHHMQGNKGEQQKQRQWLDEEADIGAKVTNEAKGFAHGLSTQMLSAHHYDEQHASPSDYVYMHLAVERDVDAEVKVVEMNGNDTLHYITENARHSNWMHLLYLWAVAIVGLQLSLLIAHDSTVPIGFGLLLDVGLMLSVVFETVMRLRYQFQAGRLYAIGTNVAVHEQLVFRGGQYCLNGPALSSVESRNTAALAVLPGWKDMISSQVVTAGGTMAAGSLQGPGLGSAQRLPSLFKPRGGGSMYTLQSKQQRLPGAGRSSRDDCVKRLLEANDFLSTSSAVLLGTLLVLAVGVVACRIHPEVMSTLFLANLVYVIPILAALPVVLTTNNGKLRRAVMAMERLEEDMNVVNEGSFINVGLECHWEEHGQTPLQTKLLWSTCWPLHFMYMGRKHGRLPDSAVGNSTTHRTLLHAKACKDE